MSLTEAQRETLLEKAARLAGHEIENEPVWQVRCQGCGWETLHIGMGYRVIGGGKKGPEVRVASVPCHCGGTLALVELVYKPAPDEEEA